MPSAVETTAPATGRNTRWQGWAYALASTLAFSTVTPIGKAAIAELGKRWRAYTADHDRQTKLNRQDDALAQLDAVAAPNTALQLDLYHRQMILPQVGPEGQER